MSEPRSSETSSLSLSDSGTSPWRHAQSQTFDDGGLAHAGFADEDRIVLGAAREDLDDAHDLVVAADDRIELVLASQLGQRTGVFVERAEFLGLAVL